MQTQVSKSRFKAKALELFRHIETSGESLVITDNGVPKLEVRPYHAPTNNPLAQLKNCLLHYEHPTSPVDDNLWDAAQ